MKVAWINPVIERGSARWPACQADIASDESRKYRERIGMGVGCGLRAKVDYSGTLLCVRHAQARALAEVMGSVPSIGREHATD